MSSTVVTQELEGRALAEACVDRARAIAPEIATAAPAIEAAGRLTPGVLATLHGAGMFRLALPSALGGAELAPHRLAEVLEVLAGADASVAWCVGQASGCALSAARLDDATAREVFGAPDAVLAWGAGKPGTMTEVDGGYRVDGTWGFASGAGHATWIGAHCTVRERDGSPRLDAAGAPVVRTALMPATSVELGDDWRVIGLRGTYSVGYRVDGVVVPDALAIDRDAYGAVRCAAPLYRFGYMMVYAACFSGVALGIAGAMLADLVALARHKTPRAAIAMRDSQSVQLRIAELEARRSGARAFQREALEQAWSHAVEGRELPSGAHARLRLATTWAIGQATDVSEQVYRLAGATAIFDDGVFERRFRDAHAVSQQIQGRYTNLENVGRFLLGDADAPL